MQNIKYLLLSFILISFSLRSWGQDLPVNPETKLVSISNIVTVQQATAKDLKQRVEEWIALRSNSFQALFNVERSAKRRKRENVQSPPNFTFEKKLDTEAKLVYFILMDNTPKFSQWEQKYTKGVPTPEIIQFNLIVLLKENKIKYEFTSFAHISADPLRNSSGGPFENDKPDASKHYMKKSYWKELKLKTIEKVKLIANDLEGYITHPVNTEMNF